MKTSMIVKTATKILGNFRFKYCMYHCILVGHVESPGSSCLQIGHCYPLDEKHLYQSLYQKAIKLQIWAIQKNESLP